jgi:hypothetical protein
MVIKSLTPTKQMSLIHETSKQCPGLPLPASEDSVAGLMVPRRTVRTSVGSDETSIEGETKRMVLMEMSNLATKKNSISEVCRGRGSSLGDRGLSCPRLGVWFVSDGSSVVPVAETVQLDAHCRRGSAGEVGYSILKSSGVLVRGQLIAGV